MQTEAYIIIISISMLRCFFFVCERATDRKAEWQYGWWRCSRHPGVLVWEYGTVGDRDKKQRDMGRLEEGRERERRTRMHIEGKYREERGRGAR